MNGRPTKRCPGQDRTRQVKGGALGRRCLRLLGGLTACVVVLALLAGGSSPLAQEGVAEQASREVSIPTPRNIQFVRLSTSEGMSQASVNAIAQDAHGFLWFATQEGLNRYDGYEFVVYQHDPANQLSIPHNWVWTVFVDSAGVLWAGTDGGGLSRFDAERDGFVRFQNDPSDPGSLSNDRVRVVYEDRRGTLWVGTDGGGLNRFDPDKGVFVRYLHDPQDPASLGNNTVLSLLEDRRGALWVGTDGGGLSRLDRINGRFQHFRHDPTQPGSLSQDRVRSLFEDIDGRLWVGTYEGGVNLLDRKAGEFEVFQHDPMDPSSLSQNRVRSVFQDREGTIWVATDGGLNEWLPDIKAFLSYRNDSADPYSLSNDRITSVFQDRGGVLWVGTYNGINKRNHLSEAFVNFSDDPDSPLPLSGKVVTAITESGKGVLWVGSYGGGLTRLDLAGGSASYFKHQSGNHESLSDDQVMAILADQAGQIWVGTRGGGLNRLDPDSGTATRYRHDPTDGNSLSADGITCLYGDPDGTLWVGTYGGGLNRLDPGSDRFSVFRHNPYDSSSLSSDRVLDVHRDAAGVLWIGTEDGGLNRFDEPARSFVRYRHDPGDPNSLSSDAAWEILEGSDGSLWIATMGGGLNRWTPADRQAGRPIFRQYRKRDGLLSDTIFGVLEEQSGLLWLSSNGGLSSFDPKQGQIRHFDERNGVRGGGFTFGARHLSQSGRMYFGGTEGIVAFDPGDLHPNEHRPQLAVTAASQLGSLGSSFSQDAQPAELTLRYSDRYVAFDFTALDFVSPDKNRYSYKLDGFDQDWIDPGGFRRATYTNLAPGSYAFQVKASNNDGYWSEDHTAFRLRVVPPPWKTIWAFMLYALAGLGIVGSYFRSQHTKLAREMVQRRDLQIQVELRTRELAQRNTELETLNQQLSEASMTDSLTGLRNRRYLYEHIQTEVAALDRVATDRIRATGEATSVDIAPGLFFMMIDLDGFKTINDTYGHHAGDLALEQVRDILQACCRKSDTIIRWGGDEFLVVGYPGGKLGAERLAERIRTVLAEHQFQLGGGHVGRLSGSIGFAMYPFVPAKPKLVSWEQVSAIADQASYIAKQSKRNAWVGIYSTGRDKGLDRFDRMKMHFEALMEQGAIEIVTSIEGPLVLADNRGKEQRR